MLQPSSWPVAMAEVGRPCAAVCLLLAARVMCSAPLGAEQEEDSGMSVATDRQGTWSLFAAPYGWLTGVSGTAVTDGESLEIEVPFEDFLDATRAGPMLYFEAGRNRLFVAFDGTWATLGGDSDGTLIDLDVEIRQRIYNLRVGYEVLNQELGAPIHRSKFDWHA